MGDQGSKEAGAEGSADPCHPGAHAHVGTGMAGAVAAGILARKAHEHHEAKQLSARGAEEARAGLEAPKVSKPQMSAAVVPGKGAAPEPARATTTAPTLPAPTLPAVAPTLPAAATSSSNPALAEKLGKEDGKDKGKIKNEKKKDRAGKGEAVAERKDSGKNDKPKDAKEGKGRVGGKGRDVPNGPFGSGNGFRLNVKNLTNDATGDTLKTLFRPFGNVILSQVKTREDGKSRGFGFVVFQTEAEAKAAIDGMHNKDVGSKKMLSVSPAERRIGDDVVGDGDDARGKGKGGKGKGFSGQSPPREFIPQSAAAAEAQPLMMMQQHAAYLQQAAYWQHAQAQQAQQAQVQEQAQAQHHAQLQQAHQMQQMQQMHQMQQMQMQQMQAGASSPPGTWAGRNSADPFGMYGYAPAAPSLQATGGDAGAGPGPPEYEGSLKSISERNGYGFIVCAATYKLYGRDVYIDRELLPEAAKVTSRLRFTVTTTVKGEKGEARPKAATATLVRL